MPRLGATFVPGGYDDYYMPEVIAPAPQRVMPEVPQNMQEDLQRMELEARSVEPRRTDTNPASWSPTGAQFTQNTRTEETDRSFKPFQSSGAGQTTMDSPSFSPFPKVKGENIPPSDEEKEEILLQARDLVLHSNNVSMQVTWARDALIWVEVAAEARAIEWKRDGKVRDRPSTPKIQHDLRVDAVNIIDYLAGQDHPEACFMKGKWLEFGKFGYRENKREAYSWYKKSAEHGCGRAEYRMGMLYENSNDIVNAIKHYTLGVKLKDSASNYRLGMMHLMGQHGHQKDVLQGLAMIHDAADTADEDAPQGSYVYGMLIARELPDIEIPDGYLPLDISAARQYIEKSAYLGFAKAQLKMGQAYELSQLGCDFNPAYSLHYYGLAARQGQPEAALGVSRWFLFGFENQFAKNEQLAFKYAQDAANAGLATGEFAMGYYYEIGIHVQKDIRAARKWYDLAAEHGNQDAKGRIESLRQSKTLTKQDHETTTLTRIKSQHGSQRGARPERFTRPNDVLPTLSESSPATPVGARPPVPGKSQPSPPRHQPTISQDSIEFPDPSRHNTMNSRPPAFTVNLNPNIAPRPKSTAPYPEEDRPPPLTIRPKSTAPYPDDDMTHQRPPLSPHYNSGIRPSSSAGPQADRPLSAFGIRPLAGNAGPRTASPQGRLQPQAPSNYRQPSPGAPRQDLRPESAHWQPQIPNSAPQRLGAASAGPGYTVPAGTAPVGDPTRTRLHKTNPNLDKPQPVPQQGQPAGQYQPVSQPNLGGGSGAQPGRDYGPRVSSRPVSDTYDRYGTGPLPAQPAGGRLPSLATNGGGRPERLDSLPNPGHARLPSLGGAPLKTRPAQVDLSMSGGRSSAPPAQSGPGGRPSPGGPGGGSAPSFGTNSPAPSVASTTKLPGHGGPARPGAKPTSSASTSDHPDGKTIGNGPATFEEMGIPQGKNDSDCVSIFFVPWDLVETFGC
ncbi:hypothetical protein B0H66DRAFT_482578 [Apodospora peruviana]|uniref:Chitin synthase activator n=1 Tax=Apodospora peruviana TaxID=516989 RepID=A0AAE0LZS7_9PEZI|nr:hypothetical protein B0H66DRAFT_482578 [Apodospora peruviana]